MFDGSRSDATHLVGARTFAPANRAMLEALIVDLEAAAKRFSDDIADAETYYRALNRLQHPRCPDKARAQLEAEVERQRPAVERRLTLPLNIQSCLSYSGIGMLKVNESIGSKKALLAELLAMYRDASEALKEMPLDGPAPPRENDQPAAAPASGTDAPQDRDQQIADLLKANGTITSLEIARRVNTSDSTVRRSTPWTEHQSRKANHRREKTIRKRALTRGVLASKAGGDEDPSELAAEREVVAQQYLADVDPETSDDDEARYLDQASPEELLDYRQMSPAEQKHTVKTWLHYNV